MHINRTKKPTPLTGSEHFCCLDARNHYPQIKHHTPPPKWSDNTPTPHTGGPAITPGSPQSGRRGDGLAVSKPNSVPGGAGPPRRETPAKVCCAPEPPPTTGTAHLTNRSCTRTPTRCGRGKSHVVLLRKEVIQPHLPVRLPCYDFVPIADPTFDRSLPYGLGHGLRVLPTFMT